MPSDDDRDLDRLRNLTTIRFRRVGSSVPLETVITGAREGLPQFVGELYRRYHKPLIVFLQRLAPADAEDLAQEVFLRLPVTLAGYTERGTFEPWLKRVGFNTYRTRRRAAARRREDVLDADTPAPMSDVGRVTREDLWNHAMAAMPETQREAWVLHREGYEAKDIAQLMGISAAAAATRLSRARDFLAKRLPDLT